MPKIVHFEIPADDVDRAKYFYSDLFGWKIEEIPSLGGYWLITTDGKDAIGGGMMERQNPQQTITNYVGVSSVDEYAAKVEKLGGKIVVLKKAVPGMGYFAICLDSENNAFGLWEANRQAR
jgi:predicted enzyme related to lactoylglutathione lyase